jgi:large subunit ribosomal protein L7/L12
MADIAKMIEEIKGMTVMELNSLVKAIEEEFGVSAAAPVAVAGAAAPVAEAVEEKTEFNVVLKEVGANKIAVIKAVRELTGLGLVEAKNMVEKMGTVKEAVAKDEADKMIAKLKEAGATAVAE